MIAKLGLYFATHTLFDRSRDVQLGPFPVEVPVPASLDPVAVGIALLATVLLFRLGWSVLRTLGVCAVVGLVATLAL